MTTRVPFVGRAVPHVRAGVGAVCTQASTVVEYGPRGLDLMAKGVEPAALLANVQALLEAILRAKPASSKGTYLKKVVLSTTMGTGIRIDTSSVVTAQAA